MAESTLSDRPAGTLGIYLHLVRAQVRAYTAYRTSYLIDLASNALIPLIEVCAVFAMFQVTKTLGGFAAYEVLVMFGLSATSFALADLAVGNIERIRLYVRMGTLDAVLVRPLSVLGQLLSLDFGIRRIGRVVVAVTILVVGLSNVSVHWGLSTVAFLVIAPLAGALFFSAVFVATATVAFWWIDSGEFANGLTYGGRDFTTYPVTVYSGFFRMLFAYALGFGLVAYYPALALIGRADPLGAPAWVPWACPVVSLVAVGAASLVWRHGVRRYRSTGS